IRWLYYGSWVPNTAYAKVAFDFAHRMRNGVEYMGRGFRAGWPLLGVTAVCLFAAWRIKRRGPSFPFRGSGVLLGWIAIYVAYILYVGGDNLPGLRFFLPILTAIFLSAGWCISTVAEHLSPQKKRIVQVALLIAVVGTNVLTYRATSRGYRGDMKLAQAWCKVGRWIDRETPEDVVIATPVPGAMGYFGKRTTIDMLGLTDAVVAQQGQVYSGGAHGHARYHTNYIYERDPDLMIHMSSGRSKTPLYTSPDKIFRWTGYAVYDFASDPRCAERYEFATATLDDGTLVEMLKRREQIASTVMDEHEPLPPLVVSASAP
ncbi:MAG: hypothetical protein AABZ47_01210, partial [Planctomycetota bacterium]